MSWLIESLQRLTKVAKLRQVIDGVENPTVSQDVIMFASRLLNRLSWIWDVLGWEPPVPFVAPISGGTLQFEWDIGKDHFEIEFLSSKSTGFLWERDDVFLTLDIPSGKGSDIAEIKKLGKTHRQCLHSSLGKAPSLEFKDLLLDTYRRYFRVQQDIKLANYCIHLLERPRSKGRLRPLESRSLASLRDDRARLVTRIVSLIHFLSINDKSYIETEIGCLKQEPIK